MISVYSLPAMNAGFNALSLVALLTGYFCIRNGLRQAHRACIAVALLSSACFLTGYLVYHAKVGHVVFPAHGLARALYLTLLVSHSLLAALVLPTIVITVRAAMQNQSARHRTLGRVLLSGWLYVSATGILIYFLLQPHLPTGAS